MPELLQDAEAEKEAQGQRDEQESGMTMAGGIPQTHRQKVLSQIMENKEQLQKLHEKMDRFDLLFRTFMVRSNVDITDVPLSDD